MKFLKLQLPPEPLTMGLPSPDPSSLSSVLNWTCWTPPPLTKFLATALCVCVCVCVRARARARPNENRIHLIFSISNFRRIVIAIFLLLGDSPAFQFYMPTFRNSYINIANSVVTKHLFLSLSVPFSVYLSIHPFIICHIYNLRMYICTSDHPPIH